MKIEIGKSILLSALKKVGTGINQGNRKFPLVITLKDAVLYLYYSDIQTTNNVLCPLEFVITDSKENYNIDYKKFLDVISILKEGSLSLSVEEGLLVIKQENITINLYLQNELFTLDVLVFDLPKMDSIELSFDFFQEAIKQILHCTSKDDSRIGLNGINFIVENNVLTLVTTDGRRLCKIDIENEDLKLDDFNIVVESDVLRDLTKIKSDGNINVYISEGYIYFDLGGFNIRSQLIDYSFPNYKIVIPIEKRTTVKMDSKDLLRNLKTIKPLSDEKSNQLTTFFSRAELLMSVKASLGDASSIIDNYSLEGDEVKIGFNIQFLIDVLERIDGEVIFEMVDGKKPIKIYSELNKEYINVIMPMKV